MPKNSKRGPSKKHNKSRPKYTKTKSVNKSNKFLSKLNQRLGKKMKKK